jgi:hypothetical protein
MRVSSTSFGAWMPLLADSPSLAHEVYLLGTGRLGSLDAMSGESTESEVLAQELDTLGNKLRAVETRLTEVEKIIERLEAAALTTARALEEVSTHWDNVYRAMRRAE